MATIAYEYETTPGMSKVVNMSLIRDLTDDDLEGYFYINITNGYIIRSLLHMLRDLMLYAILELTPTRVRILRYDKTGKIIIHLELLTSRFTSYLFKSKRPAIKIGLDFSSLWHKMKILGKPNPFIAYKEDGQDFITLDFCSMAKHQYNLHGVIDQNITLPKYDTSHPGINISVREMSQAMTALRTSKSKITFKCYRDRIDIETLKKETFQQLGTPFDEFWSTLNLDPEDVIEELKFSEEDEDAQIFSSLHLNEDKTNLQEIAPTPDSTEEPIVTMEQNHNLLKSLAKVCNVSDNSPIRAIVESNKPVKLSIS